MYGKINEIASSASNLNETVRDIEWLAEGIEEHTKNALGCTENAIAQLKEIIGENDPNEVEKINVMFEDLLMLMQDLEDAESELREL
jgi:hypothetical protein